MRRLLTAGLVLSLSLAGLIPFIKLAVWRGGFGYIAALATGVLAVLAAFCGVALVLHRRGREQLVKRLTLSLVATLTSFVVLDLAAGLLFLRRASPSTRSDPIVHHAFVPDCSSVIYGKPDFIHGVRVNNLGMRGADAKLEHDERVFRILMLGDSFTMGKGVEDGETFSALVEKHAAAVRLMR